MLGCIKCDSNHQWVLIAAFMVFFMQAGFAMLEAGCVRSKNIQNILLQNTLDIAIGAVLFWALGYDHVDCCVSVVCLN